MALQFSKNFHKYKSLKMSDLFLKDIVFGNHNNLVEYTLYLEKNPFQHYRDINVKDKKKIIVLVLSTVYSLV